MFQKIQLSVAFQKYNYFVVFLMHIFAMYLGITQWIVSKNVLSKMELIDNFYSPNCSISTIKYVLLLRSNICSIAVKCLHLHAAHNCSPFAS